MAHELSLIQSLLYVAVLAGLAFALLTGVLYTLAVQLNRAIAVHDLIRKTRLMRAEFMIRQHEKRQGDPAQVIEDDEGDDALYVAQPFDQHQQQRQAA